MADSTFADMQARIADELQRTDLQQQIANAVVEACDYYSADAWFQNDAQNTSTTTVAGTSTYTAPTDVIMIRQLMVTVNQTKYELVCKSWEYINKEDSNSASPVQGPPVHYAVSAPSSGMTIRLFPTPDNAYQLQYDYIGLISPPVNDSDAPMWTAARLIREMMRHYAKYLVDTSVLRDTGAAMVDKKLADDYFVAAKRQLWMLKSTGRVAPNW